MKNQPIPALLAILGLLLFNLLFWEQKLGINLPIFSVFLIGLAVYVHPEKGIKKEFYYSFFGVILTGIMLCWHHSNFSIFMHFISVFMALGTLKNKDISTSFEAVMGFVFVYVQAPVTWAKAAKERQRGNKKLTNLFSFLKLAFIPFIVFVLFFIIYKNANPKFDELTLSITDSITELFKDISFVRLVFLFFGFTFISVAIFKSYTQLGFISAEDNLQRKRNSNYAKNLKSGMVHYTDFKNEYRSGLLVFAALNLLLLLVNVIDINWIWFGFEVPQEFNLKSFVHEGTYLLIFSIILSMGIFLYFFRGSLNFFSANKWLKLLGNIWITQNVILTISVFIRNYHYIDYHGLAGKRIGVIVFLLLTVFGLLSLIYKVNKLKTTAFLLRLNGWFIFFTLITMTVVNWDRVMAHHNLTHDNPVEIDVDYYLSLDESVAPMLLKNINIIEGQMEAHLKRPNKEVWLRYTNINAFKSQLEFRASNYLERLEETEWPSWNWADSKMQKTTALVTSVNSNTP